MRECLCDSLQTALASCRHPRLPCPIRSDASCEEAYFKMNNVLIDDRRIKVDFSQSVHHLWKQFKK